MISSYIKELEDGIVDKKVLSKFDALESILFSHVYESVMNTTAEEGYVLADSLNRMVNSIHVSDLHGGEYNEDVDIAALTSEQQAYLQGKLVAYLNIVNKVNYQRPSKSDFEFAIENVETLKVFDDSHIVYDYQKHARYVQAGLVDTPMYGRDHICKLTPFGKQVIMHCRYKALKD